jgi:hypothetical protein
MSSIYALTPMAKYSVRAAILIRCTFLKAGGVLSRSSSEAEVYCHSLSWIQQDYSLLLFGGRMNTDLFLFAG